MLLKKLRWQKNNLLFDIKKTCYFNPTQPGGLRGHLVDPCLYLLSAKNFLSFMKSLSARIFVFHQMSFKIYDFF